jgi:hypothetical protein
LRIGAIVSRAILQTSRDARGVGSSRNRPEVELLPREETIDAKPASLSFAISLANLETAFSAVDPIVEFSVSGVPDAPFDRMRFR